MEDKDRSEKTITLCGGGCTTCPDATLHADGSVTLEEYGQAVTLTPFALDMLIRWYADQTKE